jgi:hypothetical protein
MALLSGRELNRSSYDYRKPFRVVLRVVVDGWSWFGDAERPVLPMYSVAAPRLMSGKGLGSLAEEESNSSGGGARRAESPECALVHTIFSRSSRADFNRHGG